MATTNGIPKAIQDELDRLQTAQAQEAGDGSTAQENEKQQEEEIPAAPQLDQQHTDRNLPAQTQGNTEQAPAGEGDWKHRFDVLNGKYRAEVPRLAQENKALRAELEAMRTQARQQPASPAQAQPTPTIREMPRVQQEVTDEEVSRLVSQEMLDEFGTDYWKQQIALVRATQSQGGDRIKQMEEKVNEVTRNEFYQTLGALFPDWADINAKKEFDEFLGKVNPLTGATYEMLLKSAYDSFDAGRAASIFEEFQKTSGGAKGSRVASQVVPSARATVPTGPGTTIDFMEWNRQLERLAGQGLSPMAMAKKQNELMAAWKEGRVTGIPDDRGAVRSDFV